MADFQVGVIGGIVQWELVNQDGTALDVSAATLAGYLTSPKGKMLTVVPTLVNTGTDGLIKYTTTAVTDIDTPGVWFAQAKATIGSTVFPSAVASFNVKPNLYGV